jgi:hypothetical protein
MKTGYTFRVPRRAVGHHTVRDGYHDPLPVVRHNGHLVALVNEDLGEYPAHVSMFIVVIEPAMIDLRYPGGSTKRVAVGAIVETH